MLSFEGNTAPYLQYAYTRIRSLFRKSSTDPSRLTNPISLQEDQEILLALRVLQLIEAIEAYLEDYQANILCNYLYELARSFMSFYEHCPILTESHQIKASRLQLANVTAQTLHSGLALLGIQTVERM
jgi:arginyl-tRNA synthetase